MLVVPGWRSCDHHLSLEARVLVLIHVAHPVFADEGGITAIVDRTVELVSVDGTAFKDAILQALLQEFREFLCFSAVHSQFDVVHGINLPQTRSNGAVEVGEDGDVRSQDSHILVGIFFVELHALVVDIFPAFWHLQVMFVQDILSHIVGQWRGILWHTVKAAGVMHLSPCSLGVQLAPCLVDAVVGKIQQCGQKKDGREQNPVLIRI